MSKCIYTQEQFDKILEERNELANENYKLKQQFDIFTIKNAFKYQNCIEKSKMEFAIDYAVEQLNEVYRLLHEKAICVTGTGVNTVRLYTINEVFKNQIEQLNASISMPLEEKESE